MFVLPVQKYLTLKFLYFRAKLKADLQEYVNQKLNYNLMFVSSLQPISTEKTSVSRETFYLHFPES